MLFQNDLEGIVAAAARHLPALERAAVRHNLLLGVLGRVPAVHPDGLRFWSFATPGSCAVQTGVRNIVLGDLAAGDGARLVDTAGPSLSGLVGPTEHVREVADLCAVRGMSLHPPMAQTIYALHGPPSFVPPPGGARPAAPGDEETLTAFAEAFWREAVPHQPRPDSNHGAAVVASGRYLLWVVHDTVVAMAAKGRDLGTLASIAPVYTAPGHRGRGYAGALTATLCERLRAEGKHTICLHADVANPASNRCYARIGFRPVCGYLQVTVCPAGG